MSNTGVVGLALGAGLSYMLRSQYRWIDPIICGGGMAFASTLILPAIIVAYENIVAVYVLMAFGLLCLSMHWALTPDLILVSVVCLGQMHIKATNNCVVIGVGASKII